MKTLVLSMISIAATVAAMTACTSESDPIDEVNPKDGKIEIKLNAGVGDISTKSSIESNASGITTTDVNNVFLYKQETTLATNPDWSTFDLTSATAINVSIAANTGVINFGENIQYYPIDNKNVHFIGLYTGNTEAPTIQSGAQASITITGSEDILYAKSFNAGTRETQINNTKMEFTHKLTQIRFTLKKESGNENITITGMKIIKTGGTDIHNTSTISLNDGKWGSWSGKINEISISSYPTEALSTTPSEKTEGIMLEPEINSITVEVNSSSFPDQKLTTTIDGISTGNVFSEGKAYTIALTIKDKVVSGEASIKAWEEENGTGDL